MVAATINSSRVYPGGRKIKDGSIVMNIASANKKNPVIPTPINMKMSWSIAATRTSVDDELSSAIDSFPPNVRVIINSLV